MISYSIKARTVGGVEIGFKGKSTDTKPRISYDGLKIANMSTFFEGDTQQVFFYDGETEDWLPQPQ